MSSASLVLNMIVRDSGSVGILSGISKGILGVTAAVGGMGVAVMSSVTKAGDFDMAIRQVGAAARISGTELAAMSDLALQMGKDTSFGAKDAADAMLELAKGGLTAAQIKGGALKETLTLAAAGGLELGAAATYMSNALNTFGLGADQAAKVAAALAGGANASTASVESLGMALSQVGPGATQAGLSLSETVAVLAAFDNSGIKGSDAGTSLKTMLTRLIPTTEGASLAMEELGLKFTDARGNIIGIRDIAEQLQTKMSGLSDAQRTAAMATIFGSDATRAATVLMKEGSEGLAKYMSATTDMAAAQNMAKVNTSGYKGAIEAFQGSVETLQITLGSKLLPRLEPLIRRSTEWVNVLTENIDPILDFAFAVGDNLAGALDWAHRAFIVFTAAISGRGALTDRFTGSLRLVNIAGIRLHQVFTAAAGALKSFSAGLRGEDLRKLDGGLRLVNQAGLLIRDGFNTAKDAALAFFDGISGRNELDDLGGAMGRVQQAGLGLYDAFHSAKDAAEVFWAGLSGASELGDFDGALGKINDFAVSVHDAFAGVDFTGIASNWGSAIKGALDDSGLIDVGQKLYEDSLTWGQQLITGTVEGFQSGDWSGLGAAIGMKLSSLAESSVMISTGLFALIGGAVRDVDWFSLAMEIGRQAPTLLIGFATGVLNFDLGGLLSGLGDHWLDVLIGIITLAFTPVAVTGRIAAVLGRIPLAGKFLEWGFNAMKSFADGFVGIVGAGLTRAFRAAWSKIEDAFPAGARAFEDGFEKMAWAVLSGLAKIQELFTAAPGKLLGGLAGLGRSMADAAGSAVGSFVSVFIHGFQTLPRLMVGVLATGLAMFTATGRNAIVSFWNGIAGWTGELWSRLGGVATGVWQAFEGLFYSLKTIGGNIIIGLWNGVSGAIGWFQDKLFGWVNKLPGWVKKILGISSPSKVFAGIGKNIVEGMAAGIDGSAGLATGAADKMSRGVAAAGKLNIGDFTTKFSVDAQQRLAGASNLGGGAVPQVPGALTEDQLERAFRRAIDGAYIGFDADGAAHLITDKIGRRADLLGRG